MGRFHPLLAQHIHEYVDLQGRVRRVGPYHRAQEVFLSWTPIFAAQEVLLNLTLTLCPPGSAVRVARLSCDVFFVPSRVCRMEPSYIKVQAPGNTGSDCAWVP